MGLHLCTFSSFFILLDLDLDLDFWIWFLTLIFFSRSSKAGLAFPVGRVHRLLRKGNYAQRFVFPTPFFEIKLWILMIFYLVLVPVLPSTSLPSSSTSLLKSSSWPETPPVTTRRPVSSPVISSSPSVSQTQPAIQNGFKFQIHSNRIKIKLKQF